MAKGYGGTGWRMDRSNEEEMVSMLQRAQKECKEGTSVLVNCLIGKTTFREGSISV